MIVSDFPGALQVKHRTTVVGEVQLALTGGNVDPVREKEIGTKKHIGTQQVYVCESQPGVTRFLVADFETVEPHWDELILSSRILEEGKPVAYQNGTLASILNPKQLMSRYAPRGLPAGTAMFCGTLPAIGGVRWSSEFAMQLHDPILNRSITHTYRIEPLPVEN